MNLLFLFIDARFRIKLLIQIYFLVFSLMGCGKKPWVPLIGVTGYISYAPALVARQFGGIQSIPRTVDLAQFIGVYKGATMEMLESIRQDWKSLVLVKKETGLRKQLVKSIPNGVMEESLIWQKFLNLWAFEGKE